jgi:hypothetical protein
LIQPVVTKDAGINERRWRNVFRLDGRHESQPGHTYENGAMAPIGHTVFQLYRQSMGQGLADQDFAAVKKVFERISDA